MIVRTYTGRTVNEALHKVRAELGERALIIETRSWKEPGLLSPRMGYEIVAAADDEPAPVKTQAAALQRTPDPGPRTPDLAPVALASAACPAQPGSPVPAWCRTAADRPLRPGGDA